MYVECSQCSKMTNEITFFPDIDECLNNPCPANSKCIDEDPGYTCECKTGYSLVGGVCTGKLT